MRRPSLNHAYRLVWSDMTRTWVAVAEHVRSRGKSAGRKVIVEAVAAACMALSSAASLADSCGQFKDSRLNP